MTDTVARRSASARPERAKKRAATLVAACMAAGLFVLLSGTQANAVARGVASGAVRAMFDTDPGLELDYSGDGLTDYNVVRNTGGGTSGALTWFNLGHLGFSGIQWGIATDYFLSGDYDGDNRADVVVWRSGTTATFYVRRSADGGLIAAQWGQSGDDPTVPGDYDGDGKTDFAVYRAGASAGQQSRWYALSSLNGSLIYIPWGQNGDFPAPGDFDGDGLADTAIQRNGGGGQAVFWIRTATGVISNVVFGTPTDQIVPGDYDGDNRTDIAVVRGQSGSLFWYIRRSSDSALQAFQWGNSATDYTTQGDYDGDGITDAAVWRQSATPGQSGFWVRKSTGGFLFFQYGHLGDHPVANFNTH
jgi:hypothetical protein